MKQQRLHTFLQSRILWILSGLVPLMVFTIGILWLFIQQQELNVKHIVKENAKSAAHIVERAISEQIGILTGLSNSRSLDNGNFENFRLDAQRSFDLHSEWRTIILTDEHKPLFNIYFPPEKSIPPLKDPRSLRIVWESQKPFVGDIKRGYAAIRVPVIRNKKIIYTLVAPIDPVYFKNALQFYKNKKNFDFVIIGSDGVVITTSDDTKFSKNEPFKGLLINESTSMLSNSGLLYSEPVSIAPAGWKLIIFTPADIVAEPFSKRQIAVFFIGGFSVILAAILTLLLSSLWLSREKALIVKEQMMKQYEAQMREKQAVKAANVGLWAWDFSTDKVQYSSEWKSQIGYKDKEIKNNFKEFKERIHPDDLSSTLNQIQSCINGDQKEYDLEYRFQHKDGHFIWIESRASIIHDDNGIPIRALGSHIDITNRKKANKAIEEERDILQGVMNGAKKSHLVYLDREFNFVRVNSTYAETCGYEPGEMIGKNHFALYPHPENEAIFSKARDTGEVFEIQDKPFDFPDQPERGTTYWDWTLTPTKNQAGWVTGLVFSLFETTDRIRAKEVLLKERDNLQKALAEIKALRGILPICSVCKQIRNDKGYWEQIEVYISEHSDAEFSHGICPGCMKKQYPEFYKDIEEEDKNS